MFGATVMYLRKQVWKQRFQGWSRSGPVIQDRWDKEADEGADEATLVKDFSFPLMQHDPWDDLG